MAEERAGEYLGTYLPTIPSPTGAIAGPVLVEGRRGASQPLIMALACLGKSTDT